MSEADILAMFGASIQQIAGPSTSAQTIAAIVASNIM